MGKAPQTTTVGGWKPQKCDVCKDKLVSKYKLATNPDPVSTDIFCEECHDGQGLNTILSLRMAYRPLGHLIAARQYLLEARDGVPTI